MGSGQSNPGETISVDSEGKITRKTTPTVQQLSETIPEDSEEKVTQEMAPPVQQSSETVPEDSEAKVTQETEPAVQQSSETFKIDIAGRQRNVFEEVERNLTQCYSANKTESAKCSEHYKQYKKFVEKQRSHLLKNYQMPLVTSLIIIITLSLHVTTISCSGAMSIDLGSEWMKVGLVAPSFQMDLVLNPQSQRKTAMAIAFSNGERFIGDAALDVASKYPEKSFTHFLDLVGKTLEHESVEIYKKRFPYAKIQSHQPNSTSIILNHPDGLQFTPLELIAMMIQNAHDQITNTLNTDDPPHDVVITVPPFFESTERRVVEDAARLVGLNVLRLTDVNSAFALSYGIFRHKEYTTVPQTILFFDQGACSTSATLADYHLKETGLNETTPTITIRAQVYDRFLGGFDMQLRLRDHLVKAFANENKIGEKKIYERARSAAKVLKESGRVKKVLSANNHHLVRIENVINDKDLSHKISRDEFENLNQDYLGKRIVELLDKLYLMPNVSRSDPLESVTIVGGNTRTPKVQQTLLEYFGLEALGKSINADEGAALAALYQAASLGRGFRVKKFLLEEFGEEKKKSDAIYSDTELDRMSKKLADLREQDFLRLQRLSLRNSLESLLSEGREKLADDDEQLRDNKDEIKKLISEAYSWLEDSPQEDLHNVTLLTDKFNAIYKLVHPVIPTLPPFDPTSVDLSSVLNNDTLKILETLNFTNPFASKVTPNETTDSNNTINPSETDKKPDSPPHSEL